MPPVREYSTPLTIELPATGNLTDDVVTNAREPRLRRGVQPPRAPTAGADVTAAEFHGEVTRGRQGAGRRRHRGRRPGRADLQDPLRVDAARLRDLVRRRRDGAGLRDVVGRAGRAGSCRTPAPAPWSPRPPTTSPGSPRSAADLDELNHVWSIADNAVDVLTRLGAGHHRRGARAAAYGGRPRRPGHPDLHLAAPPAGPRAACSPTATSWSSSAWPSTSCDELFDDRGRLDAALPAAGPRLRPDHPGRLRQVADPARPQRRHQEPRRRPAAFRPTFVLAVPRVFEKVFNTASQRATADGRGKIFDRAAETAIAYSRGLDRGKPSLARARPARGVLPARLRQAPRRRSAAAATYAVSGGAPARRPARPLLPRHRRRPSSRATA